MTTTPQSGVRALSPLRDFLHTEAASGVLLVLSATVAMVWANVSDSYQTLWNTGVSLRLDDWELELTLRALINDGLMAVFFLVVGLEIKRELTTGHLASKRRAALPVVAAIGGMVVPALIYLAIAGRSAAGGWAIPVATDIALAIGVVALAGAAVVPQLRAFLLGLAIVDDIGAILIIAIFYSHGIHFEWLAVAAVTVIVAVLMAKIGLRYVPLYVGVGLVLWLAVHEGGIHATIAGVIMGVLTPSEPHLSPDLVDIEELTDVSSVEAARATADIARRSVSEVEWLQHALHPWTSYVIVPIFALANAGVAVSADALADTFGSPVAWGVFAGLIVGKPVGILLFTRLAARLGFVDPIDGVDTRGFAGIGFAAGIGFTVALFITEMAFDDPVLQDRAKLAVLAASIAAGVASLALLHRRQVDD